MRASVLKNKSYHRAIVVDTIQVSVTESDGRNGIGNSPVGLTAKAQTALPVAVEAHRLVKVVNISCLGERGAGNIKGSDHAIDYHKSAVGVSGSRCVPAGVTAIVYPIRKGIQTSDVDLSKSRARGDKTVKV